MYRLSAADNAWTKLSPSGSGPSPRHFMGFAATPDGMLYVFGGTDGGTERGGVGVIGLHGACCAGRSHAACTRFAAAALALSCEGDEAREDMHACVYMCGAPVGHTYVPLYRGPAMGWYTLGRETETERAAVMAVCSTICNLIQPCGITSGISMCLDGV